MTEAEWLACTDPEPMLEFLRDKICKRKLRLFACSVCRQLTSFVGTEEYARGIEAAEAYADGGRMKAAMKRSRQALKERMALLVDTSGKGQSDEWLALFLGAVAISEKDYRSFPSCLSNLQSDRASVSLKQIVNDSYLNVRAVFGNPFRPVTISPAWQTPTIVALAQAAYDNRTLPAGELDPARLAVLADALEEAGCTNADILSHLRGPGPHVRGCWAIDLILGKQ
jgi:hypothetical protein